jgi:hypothetical protein
MKFEIDGAEYNPGDKLPRLIAKVIEVLDALPAGKLYTQDRLAQEAGVTRGTLNGETTHPALEGYKTTRCINGTRKNLFGNPNTIQALEEEDNEEG